MHKTRFGVKVGDLVQVKSGRIYKVWGLRDWDDTEHIDAIMQRDGKNYGPIRCLKIDNLKKVG